MKKCHQKHNNYSLKYQIISSKTFHKSWASKLYFNWNENLASLMLFDHDDDY